MYFQTNECYLTELFITFTDIRHETLEIPWSRSPFPPFPSSHLSEAPARTARHLLYHRKLRQEGILGIWMGHHLDDQVENKIIWGYGMRKVAKMDGKIEPSESIDDDVHIVRPLTMFSKVSFSKLSPISQREN